MSERVNYELLRDQVRALLSGETHTIANAANFCALLFQELPDLNWIGFYFLEGEELILGPFQGRPACVRIPLGRGVCGSAAATGKILRVANVHEFEGHIACDAASNSELVIPVRVEGEIFAVLDLDSPRIGRFSAADQAGIAGLARVYEDSLQAGR